MSSKGAISKRAILILTIIAALVICGAVFLIVYSRVSDKSRALAEGEWDGNYLYADGYRMRTDGSDRQPLISVFSEDGVDYTFWEYEKPSRFDLNGRAAAEELVFSVSEFDRDGSYYYGDHVFLRCHYGSKLQIIGNNGVYSSPYYGTVVFLYDIKSRDHIKVFSTGVGLDRFVSVGVRVLSDEKFIIYEQSYVKDFNIVYHVYDFSGNEIATFTRNDTHICFTDKYCFYIDDKNRIVYSDYVGTDELYLYDENGKQYKAYNEMNVEKLHDDLYIVNDRLWVPSKDELTDIDQWFHLDKCLSGGLVLGEDENGKAFMRFYPDGTYEKLAVIPLKYYIRQTVTVDEITYFELIAYNSKKKAVYAYISDFDWELHTSEGSLSAELGYQFDSIYGEKCGAYTYSVYADHGFAKNIERLIRYDANTGKYERLPLNFDYNSKFVVRSE